MRQNTRQWTDTFLRSLPLPETGSKKLFDPNLPGFGIRLTSKAKTFIVQYGKKRSVKVIGKYPSMSLKIARREALQVLDAPEPTKRDMNRSELQTAFIEHCQTRLRPTTIRRYEVSFKKDGPETAHDIAAFKAMYNWGVRNGHISDNPYQYLRAEFKTRERLLTDEEISQIWKHDRPPFSDIVKLLILTGQRRNQFADFNQSWLVNGEMNFPGAVMKSRRSHVVPATDWTTDIVTSLTSFNGWGKSKARLDDETGVTDWVLHDLRRYFSSTMARIGTPLHVTELILDHRSTMSGVAAIYNRYGFLDEMREALTNYEAHIKKVIAS